MLCVAKKVSVCSASSSPLLVCWPSAPGDQGHHGGSALELLILLEQWLGHRLLSEKVFGPCGRAARAALPSRKYLKFVLACQSIGSLFRAAELPAGLARFLRCSVGWHRWRLQHLEWEQCSHGLIARQLESCHPHCPKAVCGLSGCLAGAAGELLGRVLKLRFCTRPFGQRFSPWSFPSSHHSGGNLNGGRVVPVLRKTRPGTRVHSRPGFKASNATAMEKGEPSRIIRIRV